MRILWSLWLGTFINVATAMAALTPQPASLVIVIPSGSTSAQGSILIVNTDAVSRTLTWTDPLDCLTGINQQTQVVAAGKAITFTLTASCAQTGTATISGPGITAFSIPVTITKAPSIPPAVPGKVIGLTFALEAVADPVVLGWTPNSESDLAGYKIYWGLASRSYGTPVAVPLPHTPTATVSNLPTGRTYYFAVTAYDVSGNESGFSNEVSQTIP